uniref:ATP synthase n=1 Tax=Podoviridae sp. ctlpi2 TaxID=2826574 RepID=A0A8S5MMI9_9CAUD|nr:MAG TPA: ATP synthase [Podoviridae sp. ctlpi2]
MVYSTLAKGLSVKDCIKPCAWLWPEVIHTKTACHCQSKKKV